MRQKYKKNVFFYFNKNATIVEPDETGIYPKSNSFNRHAETLSENHDTLFKIIIDLGKTVQEVRFIISQCFPNFLAGLLLD